MVNYTGKFVLAPMVRAGELPNRLLALKHGADLVWGPEIIDKKLVQCERFNNTELGTVDYLSKTGNLKVPGVSNLVFRTVPSLEAGKLIFQMGTADPELAVQAAKIVINDVAGIDVNAGCPKHFSVHAGMGAALLKTPERLVNILTSLVNEVGLVYNKPISVKIRVLEDEKSTLELVNRLVKTGISNLTVHCRRREMRNTEAPIREYMPAIIESCRASKVSCIINGSVKSYQDYRDIQKTYGPDIGAMIATCAETNASCFSPEPVSWAKLTKEFVEIATKYNNHVSNTKYCLTSIVPGKTKYYQLIARSKTPEAIADVVKSFDDEGKSVEQVEAKVVTVEPLTKPARHPIEGETSTKRKLDAEAEISAKKQAC
ncbi:hypothetical protein BABINDRAFT_164288 [Babjeviella inositovora NRRL Y-12698]|uniref:DUS-like FMN-binding domain-containing protein n=1 Tax=Babjeviella inositovora NRRL Y-12698 TaxID=984486 RepID=A0A1E3QZJ5_9ASCO|nr:uncharacterized protein BABINDRAFT_164288 [Babjeviella inositovora NRRL Y-12698]ODQ82507.1 hypothetical protein BABINDRAFT_164288 [Babjeviella inositovora NRRL Y-12698]